MNPTCNKIKVVHVITRFDKGGSAENTFLTVRDLDKDRYDVTLIRGLSRQSLIGDQEARSVEKNLAALERDGVVVVTIPELVRELAPLTEFRAFLCLFRLFRKRRPQIVHTHTSKAGILGRWAAFFSGVPIIVHTPHGHVFWGYFSRRKTRAFILLEKLTARITDRIITLTDREKADHLHVHIAAENKFTTIHSGVDLSRFSGAVLNMARMKKELNLPEGSFIVGTTGRLTQIKGHIHLLEAAVKVRLLRPDIYFVFLGDGELREALAKYAAGSGIAGNVMFAGWRSDVAAVLSAFDVFVFPSLNEGMGKAIIEAMAMGKPVIASDVGGIPDLVTHGCNGLLVPPGDSGALANAILDLYENADKRKEMGEEGRKTAAGYSVDAMVQKIDALYQTCLNNP
jgi:glycosyltransferase involved in cell wall biosynthesis